MDMIALQAKAAELPSLPITDALGFADRLNEAAILAFSRGQARRTVQLLSAAVAILRTTLMGGEDPASIESLFEAACPTAEEIESLRQQEDVHHVTTPELHQLPDFCKVCDNHVQTLSASPHLLRLRTRGGEAYSRVQDLELVAAAILFNLGAVYQSSGQKEDVCIRRQGRALQIWELCEAWVDMEDERPGFQLCNVVVLALRSAIVLLDRQGRADEKALVEERLLSVKRHVYRANSAVCRTATAA